jgi:hypothetical protein
MPVEGAYPSINHWQTRERWVAGKPQRERGLEAQAPGAQIERRKGGEKGWCGERNAYLRKGIARTERSEDGD